MRVEAAPFRRLPFALLKGWFLMKANIRRTHDKPIVASLAGDVEVEEAAQYLYEHGIPAYAYSTEIPVAVLGAKYQWARGAGLI